MPKYYEFEVSLQDIQPRIWRRFLLRTTATFTQLHQAIQQSFGWQEKSHGTETFIAEHSRLVEACLRAEQAGALETAGGCGSLGFVGATDQSLSGHLSGQKPTKPIPPGLTEVRFGC